MDTTDLPLNTPVDLWPATPSVGSIVRQRSTRLAAGAYLAVLAVMFAPLLAGRVPHTGAETRMARPFVGAGTFDAIPYVEHLNSDFARQFDEFQQYQRSAARDGRFPTWNPHVYLGAPFHADGQSAMLWPFHWAYFLVDPDAARGPVEIAQLWVSAMATFALLRRLGPGPTGAFVGGGVYTFGGFNLHWLMWPQAAATLWLPVVLLAVDVVVRRPSVRAFAVAPLAAGPLWLAGHPGTIFLCLLVTALYATVRWAGLVGHGLGVRRLTASAVVTAAAVATGAAVAAAAVVPLGMDARHSYEYLAGTGSRNLVDPVPWSTAWLFLAPEYFGRLRGFYPGLTYAGPSNYIEMACWAGGVALALAVAALVRPGRRPTPAWVAAVVLAAVSLPLALAVRPVYGWALRLPGMRLTNLRRLLFAANLATAFLAAVTVDRILTARDRVAAALAATLASVATVAVAGVTIARWSDLRRTWAAAVADLPAMVGPRWPDLTGPMAVQFAGNRMVAGAVLLAAGAGVLCAVARLVFAGRPVPRGLRYALAAAVVADVILPGVDLNPLATPAMAEPPPPPVLTAAIRLAGDGRLAAARVVVAPNLSMRYGFRDVRGYDFPHDPRLIAVLHRLHVDLPDAQGYMLLDRFVPRVDPVLATYLTRAAVRAVLIAPDTGGVPPPRLSTAGAPWPMAAAGDGVAVYANPDPAPRVHFAATASRVTNPRVALDALLDPARRDRSVVEGGNNVPLDLAPPAADPGTCRLVADDPERVAVNCASTAAAGNRLLVLADAMADGWAVRVDDRPAARLTVDFLFRGVLVPPGRHTVVWTYAAPGLAVGAWVSVVTTAGLVLLVVVARRPISREAAA